ncbi:hypothetical protein [Sphingomonas sp. SRS2]|uniref:hypothetical protein n=1 Tax=Sphingomonas sp. SRS2 TaxID=133190 RepID=UPI000618486A|nr:hypothetical protein [Sphingomonas sp. SRS2]KKC24448.1 hypothetical protein WP12_19345 [Sphingomonas sp. SRS2]
MSYPMITPLPDAPSRSAAPSVFSDSIDALLAALPGMVLEMNAQAAYLDGLAAAVTLNAATAASAAATSASSANAQRWVSGTTYAIDIVTISPITSLSYRRKVAGGGTTDPSADTTNWAPLTAGGDVTLSGSQTLANKTLTDPTITGAIKEDIFAIVDGASVDIDPSNGSIQTWTLGANRTPTASSFQAGESVMLMIADGTAYAVTWSTIGVVWVGGTAPTLPTSGSGIITLWKVGSTVYGSYGGAVA